ncbi:MAG: ABC-2 family transporter protein [Propionibacteriaceae bacterium]|jgi:ABC-type uncharacterized transport system permease subunit|nr:ABC-2 family transporter protein [Propionibacteriaceae bacterium]
MSDMAFGHTLRGARAWLRLEAKATAAFRAQLLVSLLGWVVPLAFMALWNTAAEGSGVMTPGQTTSYYLAQLVATNLAIGTSLIYGLGYLVYTGEFARHLVMPYPSVLAAAAQPAAHSLIRSLPLVVIVPLLGWAMKAEFTTDPVAVVAAVALFAVGLAAATLAAVLWALAVLWFTKSDGVLSLFVGVNWVLAGFIAPSQFLPDWLAWTMRLSPLWAAQGGFGELLSGAVAPAWWMFAVNLAWIVVLSVLLRWLWPRALTRFEAVGQ